MKKYLQNIFIFLLATIAAGCYDDKGNYDYRQMPEVEISGIKDDYIVYALDSFKIPVTIKVSKEELKNVSYEWKLNGEVIFTEKDLNVLVNFPNKTGMYAEFDMIDNETGIKYIKTFKVSVTSSYKNGWMILSDLGDKSQLCFMRNDNVFIENIYYLSNKEYLSGGAYAMCEHFLPWSADAGQVFVACQKGPGYSVELDGNSLQKMIHTEKEFIDGAPADFCPQSMDAVTNWDYLISAGKLYTRENQSGYEAQYQEGSFPNFPVIGDYELLPWTMRSNIFFSGDVIAFDKKHCSYVLLRSGEMNAFDYTNDATKAFNPSNMNKMLIAGGATSVGTPNYHFLTFLRDLSSGEILVQRFKFTGWRSKYSSTSEVVFPNASLINEQSKFAVCIGRKYAYFTAGKTLYVYNYEDNLVTPLRDDFMGNIRDIALCATNYERLGIAVENAENPEKSDFMILDVSVVGGGKTIPGTEVKGKCGKVVDILYKIGDQGDVM
ncbi:MAG: PKD-like family lipoprotein [Odoribacter sp.]